MIITKNDIAEHFDLSSNLDSNRIEKFAAEREKQKCTQFLGRALYGELLAQTEPIEEKWIKLIEQIKPMLIYWTYASYLSMGNVFNTATGPKVKRVDQSDPLTDKELSRAIENTCEMARFYESELQNYLTLHSIDFPSFNADANHTGCKVFTVRKVTNTKGI